jgi:hypothetical protein
MRQYPHSPPNGLDDPRRFMPKDTGPTEIGGA